MTQPQPQPQQRPEWAVVAAYTQQTARLRAQLAAYITVAWAALGTYRAAQMAEFVAQVVPVVEGAMAQMQAMTAAYLATLTGLAGGSVTPTAYRALGVTDVRNGADAADVYGRPFHLVWRQLAARQPLDGDKIAASIQSGLDRAVQTAVTDLQLAKTHTSQQQLREARNVTGYRRELEGAHSCALCVIASTRRYHKADLLPIHPACDCAVVPIFGEDHGAVLDTQTVADLHATVAAQFGADSSAARNIADALKDNGGSVLYRDVLVTHAHGELGPILGIRGQSFTGPADIAA